MGNFPPFANIGHFPSSIKTPPTITGKLGGGGGRGVTIIHLFLKVDDCLLHRRIVSVTLDRRAGIKQQDDTFWPARGTHIVQSRSSMAISYIDEFVD